MKKTTLVLTLLLILISNISNSQNSDTKKTLKTFILKENFSSFKTLAIPSTGASVGLNLGFASIEGNVGLAIGAFAELKARDISFVPQANYWNVKSQSNFELAGLARLYFSHKPLAPYIDGGIGINFYNSDKDNFTKLSILAGGGVELSGLSSTFSLLFDGKYKLIINDRGNLSGFVFTAGMRFPFK